jgi:hypothetical protein
MFETNLETLDPDKTLAYVEGAQRAEDQARVAVLAAAAHWADLHGVLDDERALPGAERLVCFGGDGTPEVAEFCPAELGAVLAMSPFGAARLVGDALDLRHRLPLLWARIQNGEVRAWVGQQAAQATRRASLATALKVDEAIAKYAHCLPWGRLEKIITAIIIDTDPDQATADADAARSQHGVWVERSTEAGTKNIHITTDVASAIWFNATISHIADSMQILGNTETLDQRRAHAVGIIAHPQRTLNLYADAAQAHGPDHTTAGDPGDPDGAGTGDRFSAAISTVSGISTGTGNGRRVDSRPPVTLYVHLNEAALTGDVNVARLEGIGPVLKDQVAEWLGHCHVTVKPVIDLNQQTPADAYETPDRLREAVRLRTPADCFPYATNTGRTLDLDLDLDHTTEYTPDGPPGQTRTSNLGPLTRRHHRIKTFSRWKVAQPFDGIFIWKSPHGHHYLTHHTGTVPIPSPG